MEREARAREAVGEMVSPPHTGVEEQSEANSTLLCVHPPPHPRHREGSSLFTGLSALVTSTIGSYKIPNSLKSL